MICDVQDTGQEFSYGVRGSHTTVELLLPIMHLRSWCLITLACFVEILPKAVELADFVVFTRFTSA